MFKNIQAINCRIAVFLAGISTLGYLQNAAAQACDSYPNDSLSSQAGWCNTTLDCQYILGSYKTCADAVVFLERLKNADTKKRSLQNANRAITSDHIFDAHITDNQAKATLNAEWRQYAEQVRKIANSNISAQSGTFGRLTTGIYWSYQGEMKDGAPHGGGTKFFSNGEILRGQFVDGNIKGMSDVIFPNGQRYLGERLNGSATGLGRSQFQNGDQYVGQLHGGKFEGEGIFARLDGRRFTGTWSDSILVNGTEHSSDGVKRSAGRYDKFERLVVGERFNDAGQVVERLDGREQERALAQAATKPPAPQPAADDPKVFGAGKRPR
jgi:hypothetical protein